MNTIKGNIRFSEVYLEIAGFLFRIYFLLQEENQHGIVGELSRRKEFIRYFSKIFKNFIISDNKRRIDYTIIIESKDVIFTNTNGIKTNSISLPLFEYITDNKIKTYYYVSVYQIQHIIRDIVFNLVVKNNGCVIHGSAVEINNKVHLFLGASTTGKSTIIRIVKSEYNPIADDIVLLKRENSKYFVYATPFIEKQRWIKKENKKYELKSMYFIQKSKKTFIEKISDPEQIVHALFDQIMVARENRNDILQWNLKLIKSGVHFHKLHFRKNKKDLVKVLRE